MDYLVKIPISLYSCCRFSTHKLQVPDLVWAFDVSNFSNNVDLVQQIKLNEEHHYNMIYIDMDVPIWLNVV